MAHDITARSHAAPIQAFGESSPPSTAFGTGAGNLGRLEFLEYTSCSIWSALILTFPDARADQQRRRLLQRHRTAKDLLDDELWSCLV
jgi:hypothetical protein